MNLNGVLGQFQGNAATLMMGVAMHYATQGHVDTRHLDADALTIGLTALLAQVDAEHPGIAEKYGWMQINDVAALNRVFGQAVQATPPDGLH